MSEIEKELVEVSELIKELNDFVVGINKLEQHLHGLYYKAEKFSYCTSCGSSFPIKEIKSGKCPSCGLGDIDNKKIILKTKTGDGDDEIFNVQYEFTKKTLKAFNILIEEYASIFIHLKNISSINLLSDLKITPDFSKEQMLVQIYLLSIREKVFTSRGLLGRKAYKRDKKIIEHSLTRIKELSKKYSFNINELKRISRYGNSFEGIKKTLLLLFHDEENLLSLFNRVDDKIKSLKNSPVMKEIHHLCKRRISLSLKPKDIVPNLRGKMSIFIRHDVDQNYVEELKRQYHYFLKNIELTGSAENYYNTLKDLILNSVKLIVKEHTSLFTKVYGNDIKVKMYFDIQSHLGASAFVGETVKKISPSGEMAYISKYDPALKELEINIDIKNIYYCLYDDSSKKRLIKTLIHEFNHLFDKKLYFEKIGSKFRIEGLARFSEYAYMVGKTPSFNVNLIKEIMNDPISSSQDIDKLEDKWFKNQITSGFPYDIGEYMCFVIFLRHLKRKFPSYVVDPLDQSKLVELSKKIGVSKNAQLMVRLIGNMSDKQFFDFYVKGAKELGLKLIFSPEYLNGNFY
jgi:hypothetical protein